MNDLLVLRPGDDVGIARRDLVAGETAGGGDVRVRLMGEVPAGHKVALHDLSAGAAVRKYGSVIGVTTVPVAAGSHVHTHNLAMADLEHGGRVSVVPRVEPVPVAERTTFAGIVRPSGEVATRNYIGVLTTVNCAATTAKRIADQVARSGLLDDHPHVDGVLALAHGTGCGLASDGAGLELLRRTLSGYARHPNFGALLVVGLGCEVNEIEALTSGIDLPPGTPLLPLTIQDLGGTRATTDAGVGMVRDLLPDLDRVRREPVPVSRLVLGLNCGGSDGWSGVSANPALGLAADELVRQGGTAVLAETPEIYGAEHLLTSRCVDEAVGERLLERLHWWERYTAANGGSMDNNPSPGNKAGGLTTILEKSLGAVAKAGSSPLAEVVEYAEQVRGPGLAFMDTPGYDPVSVTGLIAGGANVVCFTTGRGSAFGAKPVPSVKLATNSEIFARMRDDMDLDCGRVLTGEATLEQVGREVFDRVVAVASGERTASEELGYGEEEFVPWQLGAVM
ncbi:altronate hydrolase [Nocardioides terrae]|uniref:Altronate hydrolase n=1 Tax=Nocardioides terrae TaxID=574651 RepID=A0A1I1L242_9ACTN|nr:altronate dehydratase family protein [Nocardioides terrae]SFC67099.1 altronate hydrolase [Nocardioides terrae]